MRDSNNMDADPGFQIAPMVDLILVLLVFFMSTVALKQVEMELGITLPGTAGLGATQSSQTVPLNIGIDGDGSVNLNNEPMGGPMDTALPALQAKLKEQVELFNDKIPIVIIPQEDIPHQRVVDVLNACSAARVKNISFGG